MALATKWLFLDYDHTIFPRTADMHLIDSKFQEHLVSFFDDIMCAARRHGYTVQILTNSDPGWVEMSAAKYMPIVWEKHFKHMIVLYAPHLTGLNFDRRPKFQVIRTLVAPSSHIIGVGDIEDDRAAILSQHVAIKKSMLFRGDGEIHYLMEQQACLQENIDFLMTYSDFIDHIMPPPPPPIDTEISVFYYGDELDDIPISCTLIDEK